MLQVGGHVQNSASPARRPRSPCIFSLSASWNYNIRNVRGTRNPEAESARNYYVRGRVQGVGFRDFVQRAASDLGLTGYVKNLEDGRVEVYAAGPLRLLDDLAGLLWKGPRWSDVRGVEEREAEVLEYTGFHIRF